MTSSLIPTQVEEMRTGRGRGNVGPPCPVVAVAVVAVVCVEDDGVLAVVVSPPIWVEFNKSVEPGMSPAGPALLSVALSTVVSMVSSATLAVVARVVVPPPPPVAAATVPPVAAEVGTEVNCAAVAVVVALANEFVEGDVSIIELDTAFSIPPPPPGCSGLLEEAVVFRLVVVVVVVEGVDDAGLISKGFNSGYRKISWFVVNRNTAHRSELSCLGILFENI